MKEFWTELQMLRKQYNRRIDAVCQQWGITRAEMEVLLFLYRNPKYNRAADIVGLQGLTKSHVSIAAKALSDRGLLTVSADPVDHRVTRLEPTEAAKELMAAGEAQQQGYFRQLLGCFTEDELRQWHALQRKLFDSMRAIEENGKTAD